MSRIGPGSAPRSARRRRRGLRAAAAAALLAGLVALTGCGESFEPLRDYDDGALVDVVGVVHLPATTSGDFVPGRLVASMRVPLGELAIEGIRDTVLPGANVIFNSSTPDVVRFDLPPGMSLAAAAARLEPTGSFGQAAPEYVPASSTSATLRSTQSAGFLRDAPVVATLLAEDSSLLRDVQAAQVVRVRARTRDPDGEVTAQDPLLALAVEVLEPYQVELEGMVDFTDESRTCLLLTTDAGVRVELAGSQAVALVQTLGAGRRYTVRGTDLGLSTTACSGGPVFLLQHWNPVPS